MAELLIILIHLWEMEIVFRLLMVIKWLMLYESDNRRTLLKIKRVELETRFFTMRQQLKVWVG